MSAELWILGGTFATGAGAVAISWAGAIASGRRETRAEAAQLKAEAARDDALTHARKIAEEAERQADALEESSKLLREANNLQRRLAPSEWSKLRQLGETHVAFDNTSGRDIVVTGLRVVPDAYGPHMRAAERPHRVSRDDSFAVAWSTRYMLPEPERLIIVWRYEDETETRETERSL